MIPPPVDFSKVSVSVPFLEYVDTLLGTDWVVVVSREQMCRLLDIDRTMSYIHFEQFSDDLSYWKLWLTRQWLASQEHAAELRYNSDSERILRWQFSEARVKAVKTAKSRKKRLIATISSILDVRLKGSVSKELLVNLATTIVENRCKTLLEADPELAKLELMNNDELNMCLDKDIE